MKEFNFGLERLERNTDVFNFRLEGKTPVAEPDILAWARWFEKADCTVAKTSVGDAEVSTVFLGIDHFFGEGEPILFETMIFGGKYNDFQQRYSTWEEAAVGHEEVVSKLKDGTL